MSGERLEIGEISQFPVNLQFSANSEEENLFNSSLPRSMLTQEVVRWP